MQLIFETDRAADININMSTLEESLDEKIISDAIMDSLKHNSNGNKENIEKQDNISRNEKNLSNNNKLDDDDQTAPVIEIDTNGVNEVEIIYDDDVQSNPEELLNNKLPQKSESHENCDISEKEQLINEQDECGKEGVRTNETKSELQQIQEEVDNILAERADNLISNTEIEEVQEQSSIVEKTHDDVIKNMKENLIKSIETGNILDDDGSAEKTPEENSGAIDADSTDLVTDDVIVNDDVQENEDTEDVNIAVEVTSSVVKEPELKVDNIDTANECSKIENDKQDTSLETVTITDINDSANKITSEPMNVDEVCKEIDITSDKEDNAITVLDSPLNDNLQTNEDKNNLNAMEVAPEIVDKEPCQDATFIASKDEVMIIDKAAETSQTVEEKEKPPQNTIEKEPEKATPKSSPVICRLSNSLNILSDDEDDAPNTEPPKVPPTEKQCINLEDDDDIMLIDEDTNSKESKTEKTEKTKRDSKERESSPNQNQEETDVETGEKTSTNNIIDSSICTIEEATSSTNDSTVRPDENQKVSEETSEKEIVEKPLLPDNFLKSSRKNIADMTREELEEFCILKIVESIVDRSNLSEIKTKLKAMAQNLEEYKKKAMMLTKQNRDLEVVLKSVQEEQKKSNGAMVTPLKITRSVGMQVYMTDKIIRKKSVGPAAQPPVLGKTRSSSNLAPKPSKVPSSPTIPVPRLIPANNSAIRGPVPQSVQTNMGKQVNNIPLVNGLRNSNPNQKQPEKRALTKSQSVTVDLTDDEPPSKVAARGPTPPVRLVPSQNLLAPQRAQFGQTMNTPRKVYIPISGPQGQQIKPGQTIMVKTSPTGPGRQRAVAPTITRLTANQVRMGRPTARHPAALPDVVKQYQPPNWKALPPAPDLKLSKVENGIVISWKIEGYQEDSYEEIASYQLYAYQETSSPPSTALWKKIGDVKALPLPMACTLTQFMAGFKYYFAVRAVDVKSRVGPFSLPGSILLLNKM
ncbi:hypothetical protein O3G_MSEX007750 [Manduca sexta]|uniref:Activating transcription factor 7-interacting protein Fn3 domain-containing protein n=1 Tax=Manduca sexta TaxID=7130 RepID=A0A922CMM7_MANSE|nr:hypothetical protein O3G_MSEX007750 [Manduca sexta]